MFHRMSRLAGGAVRALLLPAALVAACDGAADQARDDASDPAPGAAQAVVGAEHATWAELRDCRHSHEHELNHIRVFANELAAAPYTKLAADTPYPVGSVLVKAEYEDDACTKLVGYTALRKEAPGAGPGEGDWRWQKLGPDFQVLQDGAPTACVHCHEHHCAEAGVVGVMGYDLTCGEEN